MLEFADPAGQPKGHHGTAHDYVTMDHHVSAERKVSGNTSPTSGVQKGIEVLKRMGQGWGTPLRSPGLSGPSSIKEVKGESVVGPPASRTGYFD